MYHCLLNGLKHLVLDVYFVTDLTMFLFACVSLLFPSHCRMPQLGSTQYGGRELLPAVCSDPYSYSYRVARDCAHARNTVGCIDVPRPANIARHCGTNKARMFTVLPPTHGTCTTPAVHSDFEISQN
jgi:hypothetical protein